MVVLTALFFLAASVATFRKRLRQGQRLGHFLTVVLPPWARLAPGADHVLKIALIILNWRYGLVLYVAGFLLSLTPVLETAGGVLLAPFRPRP